MSKKPKKVVEMSKDVFSVYLTLAFLIGMHMPSIYVYMVTTWR